jgi:hypothetical protein
MSMQYRCRSVNMSLVLPIALPYLDLVVHRHTQNNSKANARSLIRAELDWAHGTWDQDAVKVPMAESRNNPAYQRRENSNAIHATFSCSRTISEDRLMI